MIELKGKYNTAKIYTDTPDSTTLDQIRNILNQAFVQGSDVRIMPDCHAGAGCVIGTTMTITNKIVPNLVGVDIGCGVLVIKVPGHTDVKDIDRYIHKSIPSGFANNAKEVATYDKVADLRCYGDIKQTNYNLALGSLGGGNHFIEINKDEDGNTFLVIHSGSRNLGKQVAELYQKKAVELINSYGLTMPKDLCYLDGSLKFDYLHDMDIVQNYAKINRATMARRIVEEAIGVDYDKCVKFETVHNYIDLGQNILRKGAVAANKGEVLIIPINMRDGSLICVGKGNSDWNYSAPHGAGRLMARNQAKRNVSLEEFQKSMEGIYTTSVSASTLDESPMVYKPMEEIMQNVEPTVEIKRVIKPIYNFKAGGD